MKWTIFPFFTVRNQRFWNNTVSIHAHIIFAQINSVNKLMHMLLHDGQLEWMDMHLNLFASHFPDLLPKQDECTNLK